MQDIIQKAQDLRIAEEAAKLKAEEALLNPEAAGEELLSPGTPQLNADGGSPSRAGLNKTGQSSKFKIKKSAVGSDSDSSSDSDTSSFDSDESDLTAKKRAHRLKRRKSNTS